VTSIRAIIRCKINLFKNNDNMKLVPKLANRFTESLQSWKRRAPVKSSQYNIGLHVAWIMFLLSHVIIKTDIIKWTYLPLSERIEYCWRVSSLERQSIVSQCTKTCQDTLYSDQVIIVPVMSCDSCLRHNVISLLLGLCLYPRYATVLEMSVETQCFIAQCSPRTRPNDVSRAPCPPLLWLFDSQLT